MLVLDNRWVAILPPRTGGTAVRHALQESYPAASWPCGRHGREHDPARRGCFHVMTVGNPYRRAVSWWAKARDGGVMTPGNLHGLAFAEWACDPWHLATLHPLVDWLPPRLDAVLHRETLQADFDRLPFRPAVLGVHNASSPDDWQGLFTPAAERAVRDRFGADFDRFGYSTSLEDAA